MVMARRVKRWAGVSVAALVLPIAAGATTPAAAQPKSTAVAAHPYPAPGWTGTALESDAALNGIACPTVSVCYAVGGEYPSQNAVIEHTTNAGESWSATVLPTAQSGGLDSVYCTDDNDCLATGGGTTSTTSKGIAFVTHDGVDWTALTLPSGTAELSGVTCESSGLCQAVSLTGQGLVTADDGSTWTTMPYATTDGGQSIANSGIAFTSPAYGWIVGSQSTGCGKTQCNGFIQHTTDGGATWSFASTPSDMPAMLSISCPSSSQCLAVGETFTQGVGYRTTNGGASWAEVHLPSGMEEAESVTCPSSSECYAVGLTGYFTNSAGGYVTSTASIARSSNGGVTWNPETASGGLTSLNAVACPTTSECVAGGATLKAAAVATNLDATTTPAPGYWLVASDGGVFSYGSARFYGSTGGIALNKPVVALAPSSDGKGYWMVASDGGIFAFGDAKFHGSTGGVHLAKPIVGMAPTADGRGYWMVASDGGIFNFGDAGFFGSLGGRSLPAPIVTMAAMPDGGGYLMVDADGNVYPFGTATAVVCGGNPGFASATAGIALDPDTGGYWLVSASGEIASCDAPFLGYLAGVKLAKPIVGMTVDPTTGGYWLDATDGGIFSFSTPFLGSTGGIRLDKPMVGMATVPGG